MIYGNCFTPYIISVFVGIIRCNNSIPLSRTRAEDRQRRSESARNITEEITVLSYNNSITGHKGAELSDNMVNNVSNMFLLQKSFCQIIRNISYKFQCAGQMDKNGKSA